MSLSYYHDSDHEFGGLTRVDSSCCLYSFLDLFFLIYSSNIELIGNYAS